MELIVCLFLASLLTGARPVSDLLHLFKGEEPPHLKKARIRADREAHRLAAKQAAREQRQVRPGEGKPTVRDVARVYWGDAMDSVIAAHERHRAEKQAQRAENQAANAEGRKPRKVRPSLRDRAARLGRLLWEPVGESKAAVPANPFAWSCPKCPAWEDGFATREESEVAGDAHWNAEHGPDARPAANDTNLEGERVQPDESPNKPILDVPDTYGGVNQPADPGAPRQPAAQEPITTGPAPAASAPSGAAGVGEVANYETAMAELDKLEAAQRAHLDQAQAALTEIREAKQRISDTQATYRPAAEAAGHIHEALTALHLDGETVANTGTIVDAMPPNRVDEMFTQLEQMEADAQQQVTNAEVALAATARARTVIVEKHGDHYAHVQGELAGDARFLAGTSV